MGGLIDTTGEVKSYSVRPCDVCIGDAELRGFENGEKFGLGLLDEDERRL
jgi:hypothetical protein